MLLDNTPPLDQADRLPDDIGELVEYQYVRVRYQQTEEFQQLAEHLLHDLYQQHPDEVRTAWLRTGLTIPLP